MAAMIHLDTHAVVWLAAGDLDRFEPFVVPLLQQQGCAISPMVMLELDYLPRVKICVIRRRGFKPLSLARNSR